MERRGQRGPLPLGLCAATCLGPLGRGLAAERYTSPGVLGLTPLSNSLALQQQPRRNEAEPNLSEVAPSPASQAPVSRGVGVSCQTSSGGVLAAWLSSREPEGPSPGMPQVAHAEACCWLIRLSLGLWVGGW